MIALYVIWGILLIASLFEKPKASDNKQKIFLVVMTLLLSIIAANRPEGMPDLEAYKRMFYNPQSEYTERIEIAFVAMLQFIRFHVSTDVWLFLFISAFLSISLKMYGILNMSQFMWTSLLVYVSSKFILHDMIQMRVAFSSGFLLLAVYYKYRKDFIKFLIVCFAAVLFHYSALVIFLIWFFSATKINRKLYIWLIPISYAVGFMGVSMAKYIAYIPITGVNNLYVRYAESMQGANLFSILYLTKAILCLYFLVFVDKYKSVNPYFVLLIKIYTLSIAIYALFFSINAVSVRISELFQIVEIILIPMLYFASKQRMNGKLAITAISLIYFMYYVCFSGYFPND